MIDLGFQFFGDVVDQVGRRIVGQNYMIERLLISILTGGHVLLEGVPGLAKTLAVRTLAQPGEPPHRFAVGAHGGEHGPSALAGGEVATPALQKV